MIPTLRPYQTLAVERLRQEFRELAKRVLLVCPTGGGKTLVASSIISGAVAKGSGVLFLAHRRELIFQTQNKLNDVGVPHGVLLAGKVPDPQQRVQVASVQTLLARRDVLPKGVNILFIDEAHHAQAASYGKILDLFPGAKVIGLTATPWRLDGKGLDELFDSHVIATTPYELLVDGYLAPARCYTFKPIDTSDVEVTGGDYNAGQLTKEALSREIVGDVVGHYISDCGGQRAVLFACSVEHSQGMAQAFIAAGVAAEHLDAKTPNQQREEILDRLRSGVTKVLCNVGILTEGVDIPELAVCILTRPTLSESLYLQMVGRVLRPCAGKVEARIHDHARLLPAFGTPYDERDFSPRRTAKMKKKKMESSVVVEGREVKRKEMELVLEATAVEVLRSDAKAAELRMKAEKKERTERFKAAFAFFSREKQWSWYVKAKGDYGAKWAEKKFYEMTGRHPLDGAPFDS